MIIHTKKIRVTSTLLNQCIWEKLDDVWRSHLIIRNETHYFGKIISLQNLLEIFGEELILSTNRMLAPLYVATKDANADGSDFNWPELVTHNNIHVKSDHTCSNATPLKFFKEFQKPSLIKPPKKKNDRWRYQAIPIHINDDQTFPGKSPQGFVEPLSFQTKIPLLQCRKHQYLILLRQLDDDYGLFYQPTDDFENRCTLFGFKVYGNIGVLPLNCVEIDTAILLKYKVDGRFCPRCKCIKWNSMGALLSEPLMLTVF
eukprot:TRINITY_DN580_c0_g1_i12.p1 TRINITY_DN580_c0_g1~~TRINITY_DN580_c0_g1_i12.p1  ORF type:complete len:258 (+),score=20.69 TRINITY_DN580_c0_g1_i12:112-885(+)